MKTKNLFGVIAIVLSTFAVTSVNAQLKVVESGNVGIKLGNTSTPLSNLSIGSAGDANAKLYVKGSGSPSSGSLYGIYSSLYYGTHNSWKYAVYGITQGLNGYIVGVRGEAVPLNPNLNATIYTYGVYGVAGDVQQGRNYGVYGTLRSGSAYGAGVYGTLGDTAQTISGRYAGYFRGQTYVNGKMYATGYNTVSDARLKSNVTDIKSDAISKVKELHPVQFQWQQVEDTIVEGDSTTTKIPHFSSDVDTIQQHYGLLAQEVQKLFPELVDKDGAGYLSVNYVELIPLLIQAIQELSAEVEELKKDAQ